MATGNLLPRSFYLAEPAEVARRLLGQRLVSEVGGQRVAGIILETEAYDGEEDGACHARSGKTKRNALLYGEPGFSYIYFTYGMHWLANVVVCPADYPAGVLFRALLPLEGLDLIAQRRGNQPRKLWCNGPAKLASAMGLTGAQNGLAYYDPASPLRIEQGVDVPENLVQTGPRVGIGFAPEPWLSMPWRFRVAETFFSASS
jgi:DNA-3-methyladenine glycosylase